MELIFWIAAGLIVYGYLVYPVILLMIKAADRRPQAIDHRPETLPSVSIIIAAYNEEKVIDSKIKNLLELDYPKDRIEIAIASDGSTDTTDLIVSGYAHNGIKLVRLDGRNGKVNAINKVVPDLRGEIVVFSDANTFYKEDAVKMLVRNFDDERIGCVCGELRFRNARQNEVGNLEGFYWRYEQFLKRNEGMRGSLLGANGGIYAIRKSLFKALPSDTIVEDFVMPMKILEKGYKVIYEPEAIAYEETSQKIVQEMERRVRIGAGDFQALTLTWRLLNPARGFTALSYFSHKVIRWFAPFLLMIALASNLFLLNTDFYKIIFLLQCLFYIAAILGRVLSGFNIRLKAFGLPYYFVSMNIALFLGFIRFCTNSQSVTWQRTERA